MIIEALEFNQKYGRLLNQPMPKYQLPEELKHKFKKEV